MKPITKPINVLVVIFSITLIFTLNGFGEQPQKEISTQNLVQLTASDSAKLLYTTAKDFLKAKQYTLATTKFTEFNKAYPDHQLIPYCNYHLAECYLALKDFDHAESALSVIDIRDRKTAEYFKQAGWAKNAAEFLNRYLLFPNSNQKKAEVYLAQGYFLQIINDGIGARLAFDKVYQLAPESELGIKARYYTGISLLYEQNDSGVKEAYEIFSQLAEKYPNEPIGINSQFFLTISDWKWRNSGDSYFLSKRFVEKYPQSDWTLRVYFLMGISAYFDLRDPKAAFAYFDKTLDLLTTGNPNGDDPPVSYWQEETLIQQNLLYRTWYFKLHYSIFGFGPDSTLAIGKLMQTLYLEDHGIHQLGKLAPLIILQHENNYDEIISLADNYLAQYPESAKKWADNLSTALFWKGFALERLARNTEAIPVFEQIVTKYPESEYGAEAVNQIGRIYDDMHEYQNAVLTYDRCISLFPRYIATCWAYLNKAKALANLERYHDALAVLDNFLVRCSNRFDCPKGIIQEAKILELECQRNLNIVQKPEDKL